MTQLVEYIEYIQYQKRYSEYTVISYNTDLTQFSEYFTTHTHSCDLLTVKQKDVREWVLYLLDSRLSPRTIRRKIAALRNFYKYYVRQTKIKTNPVESIVLPKLNKRLPIFIKESSISDLFSEQTFSKNFNGIRDQLVLEIFYCTGTRLSELTHLTTDQINFERKEIRVIGKRNKERVIPVTSRLVNLIEAYLQALTLEFNHNNFPTLLIGDTGKPVYPRMIQRIVHKYLQATTTSEKMSPHVLRHTFATHMLNHGADLNAVKDLLGHANLAATEIYTHNTYERLKTIYKQAHPRA